MAVTMESGGLPARRGGRASRGRGARRLRALWMSPLLVLSALVLLSSAAFAAGGRIETCVRVIAPTAQQAGLEQLVQLELDRHTTHRAVQEGCESELVIEWLSVSGRGAWLTGRINDQVPHREPLDRRDLAQVVEVLLRVLLHNDPVRLRQPAQAGWLQDKTRELTRGHLLLEGGVAQGALLLDRVQFLPGLVLGARREGDTLQLGGRLAVLFGQDPNPRLRATFRAALSVDAMFWASPAGVSSLFGGPVIGYELTRYHGPATLVGGGATDEFFHQTPLVGARGGFEALRHTDLRLTFAVELALPVLPARDKDAGVVSRWVPSSTVTAGLAF